jgi:non-canonical poly(A) RNA polymerase PAPD5/7
LNDFVCIKPLIYVLKYCLRQRKLNDTYTGGISSFLLFNLLFSYIQYHTRLNQYSSDLTLGNILVGFFQFFAFDFNYEQVGISLKHGGYFFKKHDRDWYIS